MLDKTLCAAFGIDEFNQWIMKQLDSIEDKIYDKYISLSTYVELRAQYDILKAARDAYCKINQKKVQTNLRNTDSKYTFEILLFDSESNPSRFEKVVQHFDYLCPLCGYIDVSISDLALTVIPCINGNKIIIKGLIVGKNAEALEKIVDLKSWGKVSLMHVLITPAADNI